MKNKYQNDAIIGGKNITMFLQKIGKVYNHQMALVDKGNKRKCFGLCRF